MYNLVVHNLVPEQTQLLLVPESVISTAELNMINNVVFNSDDASDVEWAIYNRLSGDDNGIEKLSFPYGIEPEKIGQIFCVDFMM